MMVGTKDLGWVDYEGDEPLLGGTSIPTSKRSSRRRMCGDEASSSRWMTVPISSEDLTPLAPPVDRSPPLGSAESRTRWSTKVATVKSLRSPDSISSFSRKKGIVLEAPPKELENNSRTISTSTAGSSCDSEKEQVPPSFTRHPSKQKDPVPPPRPEVRENPASRGSERRPTEVREPPAPRCFPGSELVRSGYSSHPLSTPDSKKLVRAAFSPPMSPRPDTARGRSIARTPNVNTRGRTETTSRSGNVSVGSASFSSAKHHPAVRSQSRGRPAMYVESKPKGRSSRSRTPAPASSVARGRAQTPISNVSTRIRSSSLPRPTSTTSRDRSSSRTRPSSDTSSQSRGRSSSRPRPPLTRENSRSNRNRTRSASLTRMASSPSATSSSKQRVHLPPPSTYRTRQELLEAASPMRGRSMSESDAQSGYFINDWNPGTGLISFDSCGTSPLLESSAHKKSGLMEKLFGDQVDVSALNRIAGSLGYEIRPRILLAATVYHNTATNLWITTINTNQRGVAKNPATANKFLKAFSFSTESEARESAIANAPPKMVPFNESPVCFSCKGRFAVFRRAAHCRNCGVCVCSPCSTTWPARMIPATYNLKNEAQVKICRSCHSLSSSFKKALLNGDLEEAIALYGTGNVNLRTPFKVSKKKDELMYPVHCAADGGNLNLLRWLIDDHFCPITIHRSGGKKNKEATRGNAANSTNNSSVLTSKGRSVLSIALENLKVDMMRYLVVERCVSIYECKDLRSSLSALAVALTTLPHTSSEAARHHAIPSVARWDQASFDDNVSEPSSLGVDDMQFNEGESTALAALNRRGSRGALSRNGSGDCIICCDRKINCVATPCGHQICCIECSSNLTKCPVCNDQGSFIKIFRP